MRKLKLQMQITVEGFVADPEGQLEGRLARLRPPHQKEYRARSRAVRQRPTPTQARSRLVKGEDGPSDSALAAARGGRLRPPAADRHAARCASRALCLGVRPLALYALEGVLRRSVAAMGL